MTYRPILLSAVYFLFAFGALAQSSIEPQRIYLSGKDAGAPQLWDFRVSDGLKANQWSKIPVPSNWEMQGFGTLNYGHDHRKKEVKLGDEIGEYKTNFSLPKRANNQRLKLVFEGAMTDTEVKVNGKSAGEKHQGGFQTFSYDITDLVKWGRENQLEVTVSKRSSNESVNKAEREADFWIFGGIYRPVFLEILPEYHFTRIALDAKANGTIQGLVTLNQVPKSGKVTVEIKDLTGKSLGSLSSPISGDSVWVSGSFPQAKTWSPEKPNLYTGEFAFISEGERLFVKSERFGFRTVELRPKDGFYVNGVKTIFKGVNRHSFHPERGRALSEQDHLTDVLLMKEMNMNAVRMSHYQPDTRFLELCDSLGLYVLDELTGWQDGYDTLVGPKLVQELVLKDANHPSVIAWNNGNEGGWDFYNEQGFHDLDIQNRPVLYPWLLKNEVDTHHYPSYKEGIQRLSNGSDIFVPTEILHGLYDGGHGAGLDDFWTDYGANPLSAGMFLWVFKDEALLRPDRGSRYDTDGNHAPDGILGPNNEKEGSFFTIKEIWSPIQILPMAVTPEFDGRIRVQNAYQFANLNESQLRWSVKKLDRWGEPSTIHVQTISLPDAVPGETKVVQLEMPEQWERGDYLELSAIGIHDEELYTWTYPIREAQQMTDKVLGEYRRIARSPLKLSESDGLLTLTTDERRYVFDMKALYLREIWVKDSLMAFAQASETVEGITSEKIKSSYDWNSNGSVTVTFEFKPYPNYIRWTVFADGKLKMEASDPKSRIKEVDFLGIGFDLQESKVKSVKWIGDGPYRVWQNRRKGVEFGIWEKAYNDTQTGYSYDQLIYPEFKGYHANLYALKLELDGVDLIVRAQTPGLFFNLFQPIYPEDSSPGVKPPFPKSDLSFLYTIPGIGTKFHRADEMGPQAQKTSTVSRAQDEGYPIVLWFDFN
ncbi:glycoside hydrolase family 2 protein [Algoriphagus namhaensis]